MSSKQTHKGPATATVPVKAPAEAEAAGNTLTWGQEVLTIEATDDRVWVMPLKPRTRTKGGIELPDRVSTTPRPIEGTVLAVGPGRRLEDGTIVSCSVRVGDHVFMPVYGGAPVDLPDGRTIRVLKDNEILARVESDKAKV